MSQTRERLPAQVAAGSPGAGGSEGSVSSGRPAGAARPPGRPRSERADKAIVEATVDLLAEEGGVAGVSIEAVAARAGVGKTTIYRRWPNKEALIIDALAALKEPFPAPVGASVREDLIAIAQAFVSNKTDKKRLDCYWSIMGGAERYPELMARFTREVIEPRRDVIRTVLRRGVTAGELRPDLDVETALWLIMGALAQRARAFGAGPVPDDFAARVVDALMTGIAAR
ncbi:TetR/AcrR family transcriptional regulator [Actinoallomurus iriomotensis]|jgi:AcrR family transcriptional regulator|uniref:TetR family transcriptional regulator n=1 Tax=Actinoallomurus iriomotensis TaxID=478107 RepID=A0A9W6RAS1_9ACTN|nr:TetR/AcrR family transcriptional regulator [Actinoallomurus iriomotensis]GLY72179.1 TetR family transcriptional regulator [Actinoallomurus iriomotensis]